MKASLILLTMFSLLTVAFMLAGCTPGSDPLEGTSWSLYAYRKTKPIEGTVITASFADGKVGGSFGCNHYSTSYRIKDDSITFDAIATTLMACMEPEGAMEQEQLIASYMMEVKTFRIEGDLLYLYFDPQEALTFQRQENP